jgi:hypothetical protein
MLQERQRFLLNLLQALGGEVGHTDFQKLLFLFTQEFQSKPAYDFVPYKFGGRQTSSRGPRVTGARRKHLAPDPVRSRQG